MTKHDKADEFPSETKDNSNDNEAHETDALSQRGAIALAKKLQHYWHEQGYPAARFLGGADRGALCESRHL